jgi:hypothetical protein
MTTDLRTPAERHRAMSWAQRLKRVFGIEIEIEATAVRATAGGFGFSLSSQLSGLRRRHGAGVTGCAGSALHKYRVNVEIH